MSTNPRPLRIGLVGVGTHGRHAVIPAFTYSQHCKLVAVADSNPANLEAIEHWNGPRYSSAEAMLKAGGLDVLYIATLPETHCVLTLAGLEHGLHVICEKPMAANLAEAEQMVHAAECAGRELIVMFENRFHPSYLKIHDWIASGHLGQVEALHMQSFGKHPVAQPRRTHLLNAAGCLDCGIHMLDLARFWLGRGGWEEVHALGAWFGEEVINAPHIAILARLEDGPMVTFEDSFSYGLRVEAIPRLASKNTLAIVGSHGVITDLPGPERAYGIISDRFREEVFFETLPHEIEIAKVADQLALELAGQETGKEGQLARGIDGLQAQWIVDEVNRQCRAKRRSYAT